MIRTRKFGAGLLVLALLVGAYLAMGPTWVGTVMAEEGPWVLNPANGHYYRLTDPIPWIDAEAKAVLWRGHLVTLNSWEEELWIKNTFGEDEWYWIGFNDIKEEGNWVWSSGEPVVYENWAEGEPNNIDDEDIAVMNWCWEGEHIHDPCLGDHWNDMGVGDLRGVVERAVSEVAIDIKPGSYPNSINLGSKGKVQVVVLTTEDFDASTVDPETVLFAEASPMRWAVEDVDRDHDMDLLLHFSTQELDLDENSTEGVLDGKTYDGLQIRGVDTVNIVP